MTTLDLKKERRGGFFSVYKPGQGKWVRWSTVAALAIIVLLGAYTIAHDELATFELWVKALSVVIIILLGALLTFWMVNSTRLAEFMIMTESEMRKVSWPSRREVFTSTKVVILLTLLLGVLLAVVDWAFLAFFIWIKIA